MTISEKTDSVAPSKADGGNPSATAHRCFRRAAVLLVAVVTLAISTRLITLRGWLSPIRVAGGSMAPALLGPHQTIVCRDCRFSFDFADDYPPLDRRAVCPNCGYGDNDADAAIAKLGDRVSVDTLAPRWRTLRRFEPIAFHDSAHDGQLTVKRLAALPGESIAIREGELFIDGRLVRKTDAERRELRILIHDDSFRPRGIGRNGISRKAPLPERWQAESIPSGWSAVDNGYRVDRPIAGDDPASFDWLSYRHFPCFAGPIARTIETPVVDLDAHNPGLTRTRLHPTAEVSVALTLRSSGNGRLAFAAIDGRDRFQLELDVDDENWSLSRNGEPLTASALPNRLTAALREGDPVEVEFGICDCQVCLSIDGRQVTRFSYRRRGSLTPAMRSLSFGSWRNAVVLANLRVYRDIYYLGPTDEQESWPSATATPASEQPPPQTYFVLGDNPPASLDSRHRPEGVREAEIVGIVKRRR